MLEKKELTDSVAWWLPEMRKSGFVIYWMIILLITACFISLFFIHVDVTVGARGAVRPVNESAEIKSIVQGVVQKIFYQEGQLIYQDSVLLTITNPQAGEKNSLLTVRAPITGHVLENHVPYPGAFLQTGEMICTVSPAGILTAECFVDQKDIVWLHVGQPARFRIEALNYNYFGEATGKISFIDNDFTLKNKIPGFKVRCTLNEQMLSMRNGFHANLKKGMELRAMFVICRRSLWQLLCEGPGNWKTPDHPSI